MTLTVGMATFADFDGVFFSTQAARLYHRGVDELVIVDNDPGSAHGQATKDLAAKIGAKYEPFTQAGGTAAPRNRVFELATGDVVCCIDPHVLLLPGAVEALRNIDTDDLYSGPMIYDDLRGYATHFDDVWGDDQMWGRWGTVNPLPEGPFEIGAMGLGMFACRRDAWLGFNAGFRGFGGEEWYIHEKYRKAGRKCFCLPAAKWLHRFGRPGGVKYHLDIWDKARNYVIGLTELGIPLDRAKQSFVGAGKISEVDWETLVRNPEFNRSCNTCKRAPSLDELFARVKANPRDLDQHADWLKELAAGKRVIAFVKRVEWNAILAAGRPTSLTVHQKEDGAMLREVHAAVREETEAMTYSTVTGGDSLTTEPQACDLLVIDTVHQYSRLLAELERHAPLATRVLVRASNAFGEKDEGGSGPGLLSAVRKWVKDHPEWTVTRHRNEQYGMTLLSQAKEDKVELPPLWKQAANAAKASWRAGQNVLTNYGDLKDSEKQDERLGLCLVCPQHNNGRCAVCGCPLDRKTSFPTEKCPIGRW